MKVLAFEDSVDIEALLASQDAKADAILAKANEDSGDFLNLSAEAAVGIAGTIALVYETENQKFEAERKAAMNANYKPKKRKRRGGDWLPSPTQSFDNTASFDDGEEDDGEEEADEEAEEPAPA